MNRFFLQLYFHPLSAILFKLSIISQVLLSTTSIEYLIGGNLATLLVYRTPHFFYRYQILFPDGSLFQPQELYNASSLALEVGLDMARLVNSDRLLENFLENE